MRDIPLVNLAAAAFQEHPYLQILNPIRPDFGASDSFFMGCRAVEINSKDTLKVCRKITKITDPNLGIFLAMGRIRG